MHKLSENTANLQLDLQSYAAQGLLTCKEAQRILTPGLISTLAINALAIGVTIVTAMKKLYPAIPILLGIGSLGLIAYNAYVLYSRIIGNREAHRWQPIFEDIIQAKFAEVHSKTDKILENKTNNEKTELANLFIIEDPRWSSRIQVSYIHSGSAILAAFTEIASGKKKTPLNSDEMKKFWIYEWGRGMKFVQWQDKLNEANKLEDPSQCFTPKPIQYNQGLLLSSFIKQMKELPASLFSGENPSEHGGGRWDGSGKPTIKYFKLIQAMEQENLTPQVKELLEKFTQCKNLKEIWQLALEVDENELAELI